MFWGIDVLKLVVVKVIVICLCIHVVGNFPQIRLREVSCAAENSTSKKVST